MRPKRRNESSAETDAFRVHLDGGLPYEQAGAARRATAAYEAALAASRTAGERAEALRTEAEAEAARLLAEARAEVARLEREADELRTFLASATNEFVATARAALAHLDELESPSCSSSEAVAERQ